jgi:hypothetical protein
MATFVFGDLAQEFVTLLLLVSGCNAGISCGMHFVHNDKIGTASNKIMPTPVAFCEIDADDQVFVVLIETFPATWNIPFKAGNGARSHDSGVNVKLLLKFDLPLVT